MGMGRNEVFPLKDEKYTKVLVEICMDNPSIGELAIRIEKKDASASEYLDELEKLECIKRELSKKPYKHRKEVSINWKGLAKQYIEYLIKEQKIKISIENVDLYSKNPYVQNLLKQLIIDHQKSRHNFRRLGKTMYQLFEKITMQIVYSDVNYSNKVFKRLRKKDLRFKLFRRFIKDVKNQKTADERETYAKFLRLMVNDFNSNRTSKKNN